MKKNCIVIGAGTYGQVYKEYLQSEYSVIGYYDDDSSLHGLIIDGIEVKGNVQDAIENETGCAVFVPIGNNNVRLNLKE